VKETMTAVMPVEHGKTRECAIATVNFNPMHHDDELAPPAGYPAAFSVGMLGVGYLAMSCTDIFGVETVRRFRTRFRELVWRGDRNWLCSRPG
jgi:hypothetical protein